VNTPFLTREEFIFTPFFLAFRTQASRYTDPRTATVGSDPAKSGLTRKA
jgi:hypothetical protein